jgi:hypothetical protein
MKYLLLLAFVTMAQEEVPPAVVETISKLKLSTELGSKVAPILTEQAAELQTIREKYGSPKEASLSTKLKMRKEAQAIDERADAQLKKILSEEQMKELMKIRKARREKASR